MTRQVFFDGRPIGTAEVEDDGFVPIPDVGPDGRTEITLRGRTEGPPDEASIAKTREMRRRAAALFESLCAAFAQTHDVMGTVSRRDERGRLCQYPVSASWGDETHLIRERAASLAEQYFAATDIPPEGCMVVAWVDAATISVEYERRPAGFGA